MSPCKEVQCNFEGNSESTVNNGFEAGKFQDHIYLLEDYSTDGMVSIGRNKIEACVPFQKLDKSHENAFFEKYCETEFL